MSLKEVATWWLYTIAGLILVPFLAPALVSAADTALVLLGVVLCVLYAVWSWYLWVTEFLKLLKESFDEL